MPVELKGITAYIAFGNEKLTCHRVEKNKNGKEVDCWIASEVDKELSVKWTKPLSMSKPMEGHIQIDDMDCESIIMQLGEVECPGFVYFNGGIPTSATKQRPFVFALTNDKNLLDSSIPAGLGEIILSIYRVKVTHKKKWVPPQERPVQHERIKKTTAHRVKLGAETTATRVNGNATEYVTKRLDDGPMVKFTFRYGPLDVLKAQGIVPGAPEMEDINEPPRETIQRTRNLRKRKSVAVPEEEASSDEELDGSGAVTNAELKTLLQDGFRTLSQQVKELKMRYRNSTIF